MNKKIIVIIIMLIVGYLSYLPLYLCRLPTSIIDTLAIFEDNQGYHFKILKDGTFLNFFTLYCVF